MEKKESALCLFCDQTRTNHDQIRCDAIRSVLMARAKREQREKLGFNDQHRHIQTGHFDL
jgi:hypothetical protein